VKLRSRRIRRGFGKKLRFVEVKDVFVYIPLLKTLQVLLKDEGIHSEVIMM